MEALTADALVSKLERLVASDAGAAGRAALAFDGDGTLWRGDVGDDFFRATIAAGRFLPPALEAMREVGREVGLDGVDRDSGVALATRLFQGYLDHTVAEDLICEVIAWACAGWREDEVTALARRVVEQGGLRERCHPELQAVLAWARGRGVEAFLVSASPRPVVEAAAVAGGLGFDRAHTVATTALFAGGVMLPEVLRPIPYGPGKAALLAERLEGRTLLAAFGDNVFDVPMLQAARVAVVVEPKPRLLAHLDGLQLEGGAGAEWRPLRLLVAAG